ncbi:MAG: hypothetical protein JKY37_32985 [Nannocystaceae bacterium]|nr:hypothetical protein [Nannocystaceae bacterium]
MRPLPRPKAQARTCAGHRHREALEATPAAVILEALFGPAANGVQFHGVNMFRTGCAQVLGQDPGKAAIILECPARDDVFVSSSRSASPESASARLAIMSLASSTTTSFRIVEGSVCHGHGLF